MQQNKNKFWKTKFFIDQKFLKFLIILLLFFNKSFKINENFKNLDEQTFGSFQSGTQLYFMFYFSLKTIMGMSYH